MLVLINVTILENLSWIYISLEVVAEECCKFSCRHFCPLKIVVVEQDLSNIFTFLRLELFIFSIYRLSRIPFITWRTSLVSCGAFLFDKVLFYFSIIGVTKAVLEFIVANTAWFIEFAEFINLLKWIRALVECQVVEHLELLLCHHIRSNVWENWSGLI